MHRTTNTRSCRIRRAVALVDALERRQLLDSHGIFPREEIPVGTNPSSIVSADFNEDGRPDLAVAQEGSPLAVLLGNGDGTFAQPLIQTGNPFLLATADINHDGHADLVMAFSNGRVRADLGHGDGTFTPGYAKQLARSIDAIALADVIGDSNLDIIAASSVSSGLYMIAGRPKGLFDGVVILDPGYSPQAVITADLDGDGFKDIIAGTDRGGIDIFWGRITRTWTSLPDVLYPGAFSIENIAVGDLNNDGKPDLVIQDNPGAGLHQTIAILNQGNRQFIFLDPRRSAADLNSIALSDVNKDGCLDLITAASPRNEGAQGTVNVALGIPAPAPQPGQSPAELGGTFGIDVVQQVGLAPCSLVVADFDSNGDSDIATANHDSDSLSLILGHGNGAFAQSVPTYGDGIFTPSIISADLNDDGIDDAIVGDQVMIASIDGQFTQTSPFSNLPLNFNAAAIAVGDLNQDGIPDVVLADPKLPDLWINIGAGNGAFDPAIELPLSTYPQSIALADFNNDATLDLYITPRLASHGIVMLGQGDGAFGEELPANYIPAKATARIADFNGDGNADLLYVSPATTLVYLRIGNQDGTFAPATATLTARGNALNMGTLAVGDLNADGRTDAILTTSLGGTEKMVALFGNGDGTFTVRDLCTIGYRHLPSALAIADINGDQHTDIIALNDRTDNITIRLGIGDGTFPAESAYLPGQNAAAFAIGDFNGDGAPDIATANIPFGTASVLLNLKPASWPSMILLGKATPIISGDISPTLADSTHFGYVKVNTSSPVTYTITNTGTSDLMFTGTSPVRISGTGAAAFAVTRQPLGTLTPGQSTTFTVAFTPKLAKVYNATIIIATDISSDPHTFDIRGRGVLPAKPTAAFQSFDIHHPGWAAHVLKVNYTADGNILTKTLKTGNILVVGPHGYRQLALLTKRTSTKNASSITGVYWIGAPGDEWSPRDNGIYTVYLLANQVSDAAGQFITQRKLGAFRVLLDV